jgi:hypothetical protein
MTISSEKGNFKEYQCQWTGDSQDFSWGEMLSLPSGSPCIFANLTLYSSISYDKRYNYSVVTVHGTGMLLGTNAFIEHNFELFAPFFHSKNQESVVLHCPIT